MKRKKSQEKRKASGQVSLGEKSSLQDLLDELAQSPKENANNVAHIISYIKENVRCWYGVWFDSMQCAWRPRVFTKLV